MPRRRELLSLAGSGLLLAALLALCLWLTSLSFGEFRPQSPTVTFVLWALSTCVVLGTAALGFLLFRSLVKLYIQRQRNRPGSRLRSKLVAGVVAISITPIALHVYYSVTLLNRNLDKWFSQPTVGVLKSAERLAARAAEELAAGLLRDTRSRAAALPEDPGGARSALGEALRETGADFAAILTADDQLVLVQGAGVQEVPEAVRSPSPQLLASRPAERAEGWIRAAAALAGGTGHLVLGRRLPEAILQEQAFIATQVQQWQQLEAARPVVWRNFAFTLALITIFMLFVAVWIALYASRLITRPIEALVTATGELAGGRLGYRVETPATDELAALISSFNQMSQALETKTKQLRQTNRDLARANAESEERRRLIDAILESIKPAVVATTGDGEVLQCNEAARRFAGGRPMDSLESIADLLGDSDRAAFRRLLKTARRTGQSAREFRTEERGLPRHLHVTVSSLAPEDGRVRFVVVVEDTTEIARAQRSEAWQEVARRMAHEIKNPLTPVALAAGRIDLLVDRLDSAAEPDEREDLRARLRQSVRTIDREVESLRSLVDSFSDIARFPAIRPEPTDLNAVARDAVSVFDGRLTDVRLAFAPGRGLPPVLVDPQPFQRAIVNLIDNAAEGVQDCWMKEIVVSTRFRGDDGCAEVEVADSGPGIPPAARRQLFLPYFSTKDRGTGLGLSIVRSIVEEHKGRIRIEDNRPTGSRFIIEVPAAAPVAAA